MGVEYALRFEPGGFAVVFTQEFGLGGKMRNKKYAAISMMSSRYKACLFDKNSLISTYLEDTPLGMIKKSLG